MEKFTLDQSHSEIGFKVRHLGISSVKGTFRHYDVKIEGDSVQDLAVKFSANVSSIYTNNEGRDAHLTTGDFFDADNYPTIEFTSERINLTEDMVIKGFLTIKGVTRPVELNFEYNGAESDPWGSEKHGIEIYGSINRTDYGLVYNSILESGGVLIGDEVKLNIDIQVLENVTEMSEVEI